MVNRFNRDFGNFFSEERESAAHWGREPPADIFQTRDYVNKKSLSHVGSGIFNLYILIYFLVRVRT